MNVAEVINRKGRIAESRDRLAAGRHKLRGGAHGAAGGARSSLADARETARDAVKRADASFSSTREAVKATRRSARRAGRKAYLEARVGVARRRASRPQIGAKKSLGIAALAGAAGAFFLDPESGARRRMQTRGRVLSLTRAGAEKLQRRAERGKAQVQQTTGSYRDQAPGADGRIGDQRVSAGT
ncbi:MAG: hypothetical protein ABR536_04455 [Solirubrobacterales bacterium]